MSYSFKDGDFTLATDSYDTDSCMILSNPANDAYSLTDPFTNEELISGYSGYKYQIDNGLPIYVYATTAQGTHDIYLVYAK